MTPDALPTDPEASAKAAGLRYVSDDMPGIARALKGKHFEFRLPNGSLLRDEKDIARIRALAIPRRTRTFGSVRFPTVTCRRPGGTPAAASSIVTTSAGAKSETKPSTIA